MLILPLALMVLLGSMLTLDGLMEPGLWGWILIFLLFFCIRPLSVFMAFPDKRLNIKEKAFLSWFGIRGIGSLYYLAAVVQTGVLSDSELKTVAWITLAVIAASVLIHGLTAEPLTRKLHLHRDHEKP